MTGGEGLAMTIRKLAMTMEKGAMTHPLQSLPGTPLSVIARHKVPKQSPG